MRAQGTRPARAPISRRILELFIEKIFIELLAAGLHLKAAIRELGRLRAAKHFDEMPPAWLRQDTRIRCAHDAGH